MKLPIFKYVNSKTKSFIPDTNSIMSSLISRILPVRHLHENTNRGAGHNSETFPTYSDHTATKIHVSLPLVSSSCTHVDRRDYEHNIQKQSPDFITCGNDRNGKLPSHHFVNTFTQATEPNLHEKGKPKMNHPHTTPCASSMRLHAREVFLDDTATLFSEISARCADHALVDYGTEVPHVLLRSDLEVGDASLLPISPENIFSPSEILLRGKAFAETISLSSTDAADVDNFLLAPIHYSQSRIVAEEFFEIAVARSESHKSKNNFWPSEFGNDINMGDQTLIKVANSKSLKDRKEFEEVRTMPEAEQLGTLPKTSGKVRFEKTKMSSSTKHNEESGISQKEFCGVIEKTRELHKARKKSEEEVNTDSDLEKIAQVNGSQILNDVFLSDKNVFIFGPIVQNLVANDVTFEQANSQIR